MKENKNKGFSLIEVIVVIAIMAIVTIFSVNMMSSINSTKLKDGAKNIENALNQLRTYEMTKEGEYILTIRKKGDKKYEAEIWKIKNPETFGVTTIRDFDVIFEKIKSYDIGSGNVVTSSRGNLSEETLKSVAESSAHESYLEIKYKKTGEFQYSRLYTKWNNGVMGVAEFYNKIKVTRNDSSKTIKLAELTGKHSLD